jgi:hypothetical protein
VAHGGNIAIDRHLGDWLNATRRAKYSQIFTRTDGHTQWPASANCDPGEEDKYVFLLVGRPRSGDALPHSDASSPRGDESSRLYKMTPSATVDHTFVEEPGSPPWESPSHRLGFASMIPCDYQQHHCDHSAQL